MSATFTTAGPSTMIEAALPHTPLSAPTPVLTHAARTAAAPRVSDPMDDFFGSSRTHESRHDERRQSIADAPPSYDEEAAIALPGYTLHAPEPITLAMYLFKFGFLFPPFWFFGAFILLSPLREPPSTSESIPAWMPEKTEEERREIIANIRKVELKWARRCLGAFVILAMLAATAGVTAWYLLH